MIETITDMAVPQIIEEWIAVLLLLALWINHLGLREESKIKGKYNEPIISTVSIIMIWSLIMTMISFFSLKVIFWLAGGILN